MQELTQLKESPSQTAGPYVHIGCVPNFCDITGVYPGRCRRGNLGHLCALCDQDVSRLSAAFGYLVLMPQPQPA